MPLSLGLDLGTTSISAVTVDEEGHVVRAATENHGADVPALPAGFAEQDPWKLRERAIGVLRRLAAELPGEPKCLGLTGQMHGVILLDGERRPVTNLITWQDRRSLGPHPVSGEPLLTALHARVDAEAMRRTGCRLAAGYLGTTCYALRETGTFPAAAKQGALLIDWIAGELTGGSCVADRSNAASTGLYDLERDEWSPSLLSAAGLSREMLPEVRESGAVIGGLTSVIAAEAGLPPGLPVCNAIGDNQAAILGSVPPGERVLQINIGTGGQISWEVDRFVTVAGMDTRYLPHRRSMLVGAGIAGGDAYAWVKRTVGAWLAAFGVQVSDDEIYRRVETLIGEASADAAGLVCEPFFRGTRRNPEARGVFTGVTADNFTPGNVGRAVLQGIADAMQSFLDLAAWHAPRGAARIIATGNAVRRNPLLVETLRRRFSLPVYVPRHIEEAAYGAALLAGSQAGVWKDLEEARGRIGVVEA